MPSGVEAPVPASDGDGYHSSARVSRTALLPQSSVDSFGLERPGRRAAIERHPMTTKADFTDEEWARLERAPLVAGMAISLADPGGPIEAVRETSAALKTLLEAGQSDGGAELVDAVAKSVTGKLQQRQNLMETGLSPP